MTNVAKSHRQAKETMFTVILVDDRAATRRGLRMRLGLESDLCIIGEAEDAETAIRLVAERKPDVIVMDVAMPGMDGICATDILQARVPGSRVVILTLHDDPVTRARAGAAGAVAFVGKSEGDAALLAAIRGTAQVPARGD